MAQQIKLDDLRFSRFRLQHEDLRSGGKGCVVHHIPTKSTALSELDQPYCRNRKEALKLLASQMGIGGEIDEVSLSSCQACGQPVVPSFPSWMRTQLYNRSYTGFSLTVFFQEGMEDEELTGWTWGVDDSHLDYDPGVYATPEGAVLAAERWASSYLKEEADGDDQEEESPPGKSQK